MNNHPKYFKHLLALSFLFGVFFWAPSAYAETSVSVPIDQEFQILAGNLGSDAQNGIYILEAGEAGNPMPGGADSYQIVLSGNETSEVGVFTFTHAGVFSYKMYQQIPRNRDGFVYDEEIYTITIYVANTANGLEAEVIVENSQKLKAISLSFLNTYTDPAYVETDGSSDDTGTSGSDNSGTNNSGGNSSNGSNGSSTNKDDTNGNTTGSNHSNESKDNNNEDSGLFSFLPKTGQINGNEWLLGCFLILAVLTLFYLKRRNYRHD